MLGAITGDNALLRESQNVLLQQALEDRKTQAVRDQLAIGQAASGMSLEGQQAFAQQLGETAGQGKAAELRSQGQGGLFAQLQAGRASVQAQRSFDVGPEKLADLSAAKAQLRKSIGPFAGAISPTGIASIAQNEAAGMLAEPRAIVKEQRAEAADIRAFGRQQSAVLGAEGRVQGRRVADDAAAKQSLGIIRKTIDPNSSLGQSLEAMYAADLPTGMGIWSDMLTTARATFPRTQIELAGSLTPTTKTKSQEAVIESTERLDQIRTVMGKIEPKMFSLPGEALAKGGSFLSRLTGGFINIAPEFRTSFANLRAEMSQALNLYVHDMTGAQMSAPEVTRYMAVHPNEDDDDVTAFAKARVVEQYHKNRIALHKRLLSEGIGWDSAEGQEARRSVIREAGENMAMIEKLSAGEKFDLVSGEPGEEQTEHPADPLYNSDGTINRQAAEQYLRDTEGVANAP